MFIIIYKLLSYTLKSLLKIPFFKSIYNKPTFLSFIQLLASSKTLILFLKKAIK